MRRPALRRPAVRRREVQAARFHGRQFGGMRFTARGSTAGDSESCGSRAGGSTARRHSTARGSKVWGSKVWGSGARVSAARGIQSLVSEGWGWRAWRRRYRSPRQPQRVGPRRCRYVLGFRRPSGTGRTRRPRIGRHRVAGTDGGRRTGFAWSSTAGTGLRRRSLGRGPQADPEGWRVGVARRNCSGHRRIRWLGDRPPGATARRVPRREGPLRHRAPPSAPTDSDVGSYG